MRRYFFAIATIVSAAFLCGEAAAATISLKVTISKSKLAGMCASNGGQSYQSYGNGGYGCTKGNCDKKGGSCTVECTNKGKCTGYTPSRVAPGATAEYILGKYSEPGAAVTLNPQPLPPKSGPGLLENPTGMQTGGPAATGTPAAPAAPPQFR